MVGAFEIGSIFLLKNLRRCVGYALRHRHTPVCLSLLVKHAYPVFEPAAQKQYKKNPT